MISRVYTVPLKKAWRKKKNRRAEAAVKFLRRFVARHMKVEEEKVKIDAKVNEKIWERSMNNPPRRIRVKVDKMDDGTVIVSLLEEVKKTEEEEEKEEKPKEEKKKKRTTRRKRRKKEEKEDAGDEEKSIQES